MPRILVVDDSRVVRASLAQRLKDSYDVRQESDGEAAWQTLVLDQGIRVVISDLQMPKVNGFQLLERVRASKLRRLQQIPFIFVSGDESEQDRVRAYELGVSDFVAKGSCDAEILARLKSLVELTTARESLESDRERLVQDPASGLYTRKYLELQAAQALSHGARHDADVSVMVLGFDGFDGLRERLGAALADEVAIRFARMLGGKMRQEDSLGHFGPGQYAVVTPGTPPAFCATFAERVREAVEVASVSVQGQAVALTVSIGVASAPADQAASAAALLDMAGERMRMAMQAGGNRTETGGVSPATRPISLHHALELLAAHREGPVVPHLPELARRVLPLMRLMNKELGLTLPLAEIERCLSERNTDKQ